LKSTPDKKMKSEILHLCGKKVILIYLSLFPLQLVAGALDFLFLLFSTQLISNLLLPTAEKLTLLGAYHFSVNSLLLLILATSFLRSTLAIFTQYRASAALAVRESEVSVIFLQRAFATGNSKQLHSGDIQQIVNYQIAQIFTSIIRPMVNLVNESISTLAVISALIFVTPVPGLELISFFILIGFTMFRLLGRKQFKLTSESNLIQKHLYMNVVEIKNGYRELYLSGEMYKWFNDFKDNKLAFSLNRYKSYVLGSLPRYVFEFSLVLAVTGVAFSFSSQVNHKVLIQTLAVFTSAGFRLLPPVGSTLLIMTQMKGGIPNLRNVVQLRKNFNIPNWESAREVTSDVPVDNFKGPITLEDVDFSYGPELPLILNKLSIAIPAKSTVLIAGKNGSGKTTLISMIAGLIQPTSGKLAIGTTNGFSSHAERIGSVRFLTQEPQIFDASIAFNVALRPITDIEALKITDLLAKVGLSGRVFETKGGLESKVGEGGLEMSSGQRQKLCIARALFANPELLIVDEPTANLDTKSELDIWHLLGELRGQLTIVLVSHVRPPDGVYDQEITLS